MSRRAALLGVGVALALAACNSEGSQSASTVGSTSTAATSTTTAVAATTPTTPTTSTPAPATSALSPTSVVASTAPPTTTTVPAGPPIATATLFADVRGGTDLAWRSGDDTLFVTTQNGLVAPIRDGAVGDAVLDMRARTAAGGERGLLGLAFHPSEPLAYLDYTDTDGNTVIDEYTVGEDGTFDAASRRQVLTVDQPYANHNGGEVVFGPDGLLYIGMGDGGSGGDPERRATNMTTLLGKVLRIDPRQSGEASYTVPADNPYVSEPSVRPEIWSYGLRNPWRMSFDRETGDLWIADVGQGDWEEIDVARAADGGGKGVNFGWSAFEGTHRYNEDQSPDGVQMPIYEYDHSNGACSISGGVLYRGTKIPALRGWYVYSDYCSGEVHALLPNGDGAADDVMLAQLRTVSAVTEGPDGELYVLSLSDGVYALTPG